MLRNRWNAWRQASPADASRLLRTSAVSVLVLLVALMIFYPHGLYLLGVVAAVAIAISLLYADWRA